MAGRTRTTWKPGQGGKPKGAKDAVPRSFKASIRAVFEDVLTDDPTIVRAAVERGLRSRRPKEAFPYVRIYAELSGELKQQVELSGPNGSPIQVQETRESIARTLAELAARVGTGRVAGEPNGR